MNHRISGDSIGFKSELLPRVQPFTQWSNNAVVHPRTNVAGATSERASLVSL
jgi:hypothetical protein